MENHIKPLSRLAGFIYLIVIIGGIFAELMVRGKLVVNGNAGATARNIMAHEQLYRWGFSIEVFYCLLNVPLILIFYHIFRVVSLQLMKMVIWLSLIGTAVEAISLLAHYAPLVFLGKGDFLKSFTTDQLQSLAYMSLRLFEYGFCISLVFFGLYCIVMGIMIFRSTFLPKFIGILLAFQGFCYLTNSFANFLSPKLAVQIFPILEVAGLGEISFCLWLLIVGVNIDKWNEISYKSAGR